MLMRKDIRTYSELITFSTFKERFDYLKLNSNVADLTFDAYRYLNQKLYSSYKWKNLRDKIILRDLGCDLGVEGYEIYYKPLIHHMNPLTIDDIINETDYVFNPEYLITTTYKTHNLIHYGDLNEIDELKERFKNDTIPWKR